MKMSAWVPVCCACMVLSGVAARSATEQWSVMSTNTPFIVMADGKGGCGIARITSGSQGEILWVDATGAVIYQKGVSNVIVGAVLDVAPDHLLYADGSQNSSNVVVHVVDSKHVDTTLPAAPDTINKPPGHFPFSQTRMDDAKGFFVIRTDTNTLEYSVVRFSSK